MPLLNIRVKSQIKQNCKAIALNCHYISNFPTQFVRLSITDVIQLIK